MTITSCASAGDSQCAGAIADGSTGGEDRYHVVFGSGRGSVRSRSQATADLYKELRDRTTAGEHLDAELYGRADGGAAEAPVSKPGSTLAKAPSGSDPYTACAFRLLTYVDNVGEVRIDVLHDTKTGGCLISLGRRFSTPSECLVEEPDRPKRPARTGLDF
jgi:hypothetical protein